MRYLYLCTDIKEVEMGIKGEEEGAVAVDYQE